MQFNISSFWDGICLHPGKNFYRSENEVVSYGGIASLIRRFCFLYDSLGLGPGDRIVIVTSCEPVACAAFLAGLLDGKIPVMVSPDSKRDRVISIAESLKPRLCITNDSLAAEIQAGISSDIQILSTTEELRIKSSGEGGVRNTTTSIKRMV